jgi:hypothetical protein
MSGFNSNPGERDCEHCGHIDEETECCMCGLTQADIDQQEMDE